jgi:hypothetical protein
MSRQLSVINDPVQGPTVWLARTEKTHYRVELDYEDGEISVSGPGIHCTYDLGGYFFSPLLLSSSITEDDMVAIAIILAESGVEDQ